MGAVAERAGVSRRALYLHFTSRAELLLALHEHVDASLDLETSLRPVGEAPDTVGALDAFVAHLARYHARTLAVDLAVLAVQDTDPDVAPLIERGIADWREGCEAIAQRLADEGRLADPWTVGEATDLLWSLMFPDMRSRLAVDRSWSPQRYRELVTCMLHRTLVMPTE